MLGNGRHESGIIVEAPFKKIDSQKEQSFKSKEQVFNEIFMQAHNKLHKDGRVHTGKPCPEFGKHAFYTVSVSPEFEDFESQIEPPIYPAVKALIDKGYHTISSCAGHPTRIHLQLGFGSARSRQAFLDVVKNANFPYFTFEMPENVANIENNSINEDGEFNKHKATLFEPEVISQGVIDRNTESFNFQFKTNYERYYFLDVNIFSPSKNPFVSLYQWLFVEPKKQKILDKLSDLMKSEEIPFYKDIL